MKTKKEKDYQIRFTVKKINSDYLTHYGVPHGSKILLCGTLF